MTHGQLAIDSLSPENLPKHVAVIMDGNGRWAARRNLPRWAGHRAGITAARKVIQGAVEAGIQHLTLFVFSEENWSRPREEINALMDLLVEFIDEEQDDMFEWNVRVTVFGDPGRLPKRARRALADLEAKTAHLNGLQLHLAVSYGARNELVSVARTLATRVLDGELNPEDITLRTVAGALFTKDWPDPDLLIRTSGEQRISNFLLWQLAYAEIAIVDVLWPDFSREHFFEALLDYSRRERRFGAVKAAT